MCGEISSRSPARAILVSACGRDGSAAPLRCRLKACAVVTNRARLARFDDDGNPLPPAGNESLGECREVILPAAPTAESFQQDPVRDESETPAAVITALHDSPPCAFVVVVNSATTLAFHGTQATVSNEGEAGW
jgi:hypothetical protein